MISRAAEDAVVIPDASRLDASRVAPTTAADQAHTVPPPECNSEIQIMDTHDEVSTLEIGA